MISPNDLFDQFAQINCVEMSLRRLLAASVYLMGGLGFLPQTVAWSAPTTETAQIAQVLNTLPPPPTIDNGGVWPAPSTNIAPASQMGASAQRYLVFVNGDSPLLLEQIQQVEPGAFRREHEGRTVIQTGLFLQQQNAEQQLAQLASQGIGAEIKSVEVEMAPPISPTAYPPSTPTSTVSTAAIPIPVVAAPDNSVEFGQPPNFSPGNSPPAPSAVFNSNSPYYVVIPGPSDRLPAIRNQVIQLGATPQNIQLRERPRGPHVAVGPFENRDMAEGWNNYLRGFGLNSRVFFDR